MEELPQAVLSQQEPYVDKVRVAPRRNMGVAGLMPAGI